MAHNYKAKPDIQNNNDLNSILKERENYIQNQELYWVKLRQISILQNDFMKTLNGKQRDTLRLLLDTISETNAYKEKIITQHEYDIVSKVYFTIPHKRPHRVI